MLIIEDFSVKVSNRGSGSAPGGPPPGTQMWTLEIINLTRLQANRFLLMCPQLLLNLFSIRLHLVL